ncbi:MAG: prolipoprotein diacylglyceryl transferase [Clostridia bacterium]|nr:prolipoprotein diacylglyceryl transferase [Clostridia bacterium]
MYPERIFLGMYLYDICLLVGVLAALFLADKLIVKSGFSLGLQRLVLVDAFVSVVVGYGFAVLFQSFYNFLDTGVFQIRGATFYGGLIGGVGAFLAVWFLAGKKFCAEGEHIRRFPDMLNVGACCVPFAHAFGRLGCLFAGCCHGRETTAWYGIYMLTPKDGWKTVVPIQLFEAIFLFALSAVLILLFFKDKKLRLPLMAIYCGAYGAWRFVIEFFRGDSRGKTIVSFLSPSQLTAILLVGFAIGYFVWWAVKRQKSKKV